MRAYVIDFMNEYGYPEDAKDTLISAFDKIESSPEAHKIWFDTLALYDENHNCDYEKVLANANAVSDILDVHEYITELLIFICMSKRLYKLYVEHNLPIEFYKSSMADLRYKLDECQLVYGINGSFVAPWFCGFFNLTRFGMGRLQFEVVPFGSHYEKNGITLTPETKVINMHIPRSGEPLTEKACLDSYLMAKEFFKDQICISPCPFVCHSWMLDPHLESFLPKHTNTYRFFKSFDIYSSIPDKHRSSLWRFFDTMEQNPSKLPADNSMRKAFVDYINGGGRLSYGSGILFI